MEERGTVIVVAPLEEADVLCLLATAALLAPVTGKRDVPAEDL